MLHIRPARENEAALIEAMYDEVPYFIPNATRLARDQQVRVAVTAEDSIVGFQALRPTGFLWIGVHPQHRRSGIGSCLLDDALQQAFERGLTELTSQVTESNTAGNAFCANHHFTPFLHMVNLSLELASWDEALLTPSFEQAQANGIRFITFAELGDTPENRRRLYTLNKTLSATIPRDQPQEFIAYEAYVEQRLAPSKMPHEGIWIALKDSEWIGMTQVSLENGYAFNHMTGVLPQYRGHGIAQALKLLLIRFVGHNNRTIIRTFNDVTNLPMIAVNENAGFRQEQRFYRVRRKPIFQP
jgi:ribosomal protein S18 acetylase RimI-like enzyme